MSDHKQVPLIPRPEQTFADVCPEPTTFRVPQCVCGHLEGDHLSNGTSFPHPLRFGLCRMAGCECREFQDVNPDRKKPA